MKKSEVLAIAAISAIAVFTSCKKEKSVSPNTVQQSENATQNNDPSLNSRNYAADYLYGVTNNKFYTARFSDGAHQNPGDFTLIPYSITNVTGIARDNAITNRYVATHGVDASIYGNCFLIFTYNSLGTTPINVVNGSTFPGSAVTDIEFQPGTNTLYGLSGGHLVKISSYATGGSPAVITNVGSALTTIGADFSGEMALSFDEGGKCYLMSSTGRIATLNITGLTYSIENITSSHFTLPGGATLVNLGSGILRYYENMGFSYTYNNPLTGNHTVYKFSNKDASGYYSSSSVATSGLFQPCNDYASGQCGSCPR